MIETCLIVDTETTGLDNKVDRLIELGLILYSVRHQTVLQEFSTLIPSDEGNPAEKVNRIPEAALLDWMERPHLVDIAWHQIAAMGDEAEAFVAFNSEFDRGFFTRSDKPWLCAMSDFKWSRASREGSSLVALCLDYGIGVSVAHRAMTDCLLIAELFNRSYDLQGMFRIASRPKALFQAVVSFDRKDDAKAAGFKWDPVARIWTRMMAIEDAELLPFRVQQMSETKAA